jgi:uncharacterized membrane protein
MQQKLPRCRASSACGASLMRRQFFWLVTATILALIAHVSFVLFMPSRSLSAAIDTALGAAPTNTFTILAPDAQLSLLPFASRDNIIGICKFDLRQGPVRVAAKLSEGFWSFAIYTLDGEQVYAINDTQADTNSFNVELSREGGLLAQLLNSSGDAVDVTADDIGWRIAITQKQGLAILWVAVADPLLRKEAEDVIKQSRCVRLEG